MTLSHHGGNPHPGAAAGAPAQAGALTTGPSLGGASSRAPGAATTHRAGGEGTTAWGATGTQREGEGNQGFGFNFTEITFGLEQAGGN